MLSDVTSLSTDKAEYLRGEAVTISGTASPGEWVGIQVRDPSGMVVWIDSVQAVGGSFTSSFQLSSTATYGTYTVYATPPSPPRTTTFKVVEAPPPPPPPPPPPVKKSSSLTITADKTMLTLGEKVTITGSLSPALDVTIDIGITCPNGTKASTSVLAHRGEFTYDFKPDVAGTWNIMAYWKGNDEYYDCSSNTIMLVVRGPVSIQVVVVPLLTDVGGDIIIYASTYPALVHRPLTISYITNFTTTWKSIGTFDTGSDGIVVCLFTPDAVGKYRFKVEWIGDSTFMPASATSSEVLVVAELLSYEEVMSALNQLKALQELLEGKERELQERREAIVNLQKQINDLTQELIDCTTRTYIELEETKAKLAEAESRIPLIGILVFLAGLFVGTLIAYLVLKRLRAPPEPPIA